MANEDLAILFIDELNSLFLVEDLSDIPVPGLWILSDPVDSIFLAHFGLLLCILSDFELFESETNGFARHLIHHINPVTLYGNSQFLTLLQLLLGCKN